jgi:hypothetical protein
MTAHSILGRKNINYTEAFLSRWLLTLFWGEKNIYYTELFLSGCDFWGKKTCILWASGGPFYTYRVYLFISTAILRPGSCTIFTPFQHPPGLSRSFYNLLASS